MMSAQNSALDLATLQNFDAGGGRGGGLNRRFCCPLCGTQKPRDGAHRTLVYRSDSGAWNCKRCGASGKLRDFWETRDGSSHGDRSGAKWREAAAQRERARLFQLDADEPTDDDTGDEWREHLRDVEPLAGTLGANYLIGRGIPLELAILAGVQFCPTWMRSDKWRGAPAAVFPIQDESGGLVAAQGRYVKPTGDLTALTAGKKKRGVFVASSRVNGEVFGPFDARGPGVIICEAPIDALSLAVCGFPALALVGIQKQHTKIPAWLRRKCYQKSVYLAFDADEAGDAAAAALAPLLRTYGARCVTLRPDGAKDWNEALQSIGRDELSDWIAARVLIA